MSNKDTLFYRGNRSISVDFSASEISSDGSLILLEKIERSNKLIKKFSKYLPDLRNPKLITYTREEQLKQRVFMMMLGYEDANDVAHLQHDPLFKDVLQGDLASRPTISRFENSLDKHSIFEFGNAWVDRYVSSLEGRKRIIIKIRKACPEMEVVIRTDSGFSRAPFYELVDDYNLLFVTGQASNAVLKRKVSRAEKAVKHLYLSKGKKHRHFMGFRYQAKSWHKEQQCCSKVESTGKGMNVRHFISNIKEKEAREIYFGFYVKTGGASENRIKEVKNMCFSDRLSNHNYWANFFRLFISGLAYEMFLPIKQKIKKTSFEIAKKWQIGSIRTYLLKVGAAIKITKKRIFYQLSKAFVHKDLFREIITQ